VIEALEAALRVGRARSTFIRWPKAMLAARRSESRAWKFYFRHTPAVPALASTETSRRHDAAWKFSTALHCAECDIHYADPTPNLFSFNSPLGACETCRGFGRVIGIDFGLIVPDESKTLAGGAIKPWQTPSFHDVRTTSKSMRRSAASRWTGRGTT